MAILGGACAPAVWAQTAQTCSHADPASVWNGISPCWLDFTPYNGAQATSASGQDFSVTLPGGYKLTYTLTTSGLTVVSYKVPTYTGTFMGSAMYTGIPATRKPAIYSVNISGGTYASAVLTLSNIKLYAPGGVLTSGFKLVAADAEETDGGSPNEAIKFESDKPLEQLGSILNMAPVGGTSISACSGGFTWVAGSTTATCTGANGNRIRNGVAMFAVADPGTYTVTLSTNSVGQKQAGMFGILLQPSSVVLTKTTDATTLVGGMDVTYTLTATNTGATYVGHYTFTEVVPANTTYTSFAAVAPTTATNSCTGGEAAGTHCTITITSNIADGAPAQVEFTVKTAASLPAGTTHITNQLYYDFDKLPEGCSLTGTPVCNPNPPPPMLSLPTFCEAGDPACTQMPTTLPNVMLAKTVDATSVAAGQKITYTITATNTTKDAPQLADYTLTEVVPAHTTFTSFAAVAPTVATSSCTGGEPAGTPCTITITSDILEEDPPAQVQFVVTTLNPLPAAASHIVNQVYYDTPPATCSLPACNPAPACVGGVCAAPDACVVGDPACAASAILRNTAPPGSAANAVPASTNQALLLLALLLGASGLYARRR